MSYKQLVKPTEDASAGRVRELLRENAVLRKEIRVAREAAEITASLVVKQFEETERVLRKFQDANAQRKAVLDSATHIAIIATDIRGTISVFNTGAENLLQYRANEVIGKATPEIFLLKSEMKAHAAKIKADTGREVKGYQVFLEYARQGENAQQEWNYIRKDGARFPAVLSISGLRDPEGLLYGFLCIAMDVTEKKRSEKALAESEASYRFLMDNIPNVVFRGYVDGTLDLFDDKIEVLTGYKKELFNTRELNWFDLIVEEDRSYVRDKFVEALKTDHSYTREYRIRKKDGTLIWVEGSSQIVCDKEGKVEFVTGSFLDVTKRKKSEEALHESEQKYRSMFISGPNPIFVLDRETLVILDASPSAEETYGYYKDELIGRNFEELGPFEYEEDSFDLLDSKNKPDSCVFSQRIKHYRQGGEPFYVEVKACPTTYQGRPAIILAASDITEIIEKDVQLFQASKMTTLGEMSAGIAHELNQPLNAIKIGNDFLRKQVEQEKSILPESLYQVVSAAGEQVNRASEIIRRLREFGRKSDLKKEIVNINKTIFDVMGIIGHQLILQNIKVVYDLDKSPPKIPANKNRLEQVIFNLVSNARDAMVQRDRSDESTVENVLTLSSFSNDNHAGFTISDTGIGIREENLSKIFEPFYTTKEVGMGMGLGLSIIYGIVRDFGGTIEVSRWKGGGARFEVSFPKVKKSG